MKSSLIVAAVTLFAIACLAGAATVTKKKKPAAHPAAGSHSAVVRATYTHPATRGKASTRTKGKGRRTSTVRRSASQLQPTPDRYMEIQKALADRGYLKTEPNGVWDSASQDAMRAFQNDRKLDPSGKLTAASLIALGLGPKHDSPVVPAKLDATPRPADPTPVPAAPLSPSPER